MLTYCQKTFVVTVYVVIPVHPSFGLRDPADFHSRIQCKHSAKSQRGISKAFHWKFLFRFLLPFGQKEANFLTASFSSNSIRAAFSDCQASRSSALPRGGLCWGLEVSFSGMYGALLAVIKEYPERESSLSSFHCPVLGCAGVWRLTSLEQKERCLLSLKSIPRVSLRSRPSTAPCWVGCVGVWGCTSLGSTAALLASSCQASLFDCRVDACQWSQVML